MKLPGSSSTRRRQDPLSVPEGGGHGAFSWHLKPPQSCWPSWFPGDLSSLAWVQGAHSPGWFIQSGCQPVKRGQKGSSRRQPATPPPTLETPRWPGKEKGSQSPPPQLRAPRSGLTEPLLKPHTGTELSPQQHITVKNPAALT